MSHSCSVPDISNFEKAFGGVVVDATDPSHPDAHRPVYDLDNVAQNYDPSLTLPGGLRTTTAIDLHRGELVDDGSALALELYDPDDGADEAALDLINRIEANGQRNPLAPKGLQGADTLGLRMVENAHQLTLRGPGTREERLDNLKEKFGLDKLQVRQRGPGHLATESGRVGSSTVGLGTVVGRVHVASWRGREQDRSALPTTRPHSTHSFAPRTHSPAGGYGYGQY